MFRTLMLAGVAGLALAASAQAQEGVSLDGLLVDAADDNRFFTRLGGTARDTITYDGLTPGTAYTLESSLVNVAGGEDAAPVSVPFTPEAASGKVAVELPVAPNKGEVNIDYVTRTVIRDAQGAVVATLEGDAADPERTIQVHAIQRLDIGSVSDAADGDRRLDGQGGEVVVTVEYANLVEGYAYTVWGQMLSLSGQAIGVFASIPEYKPEGKAGQVELRFPVPAGFEGISVVPSVGIYHQKRVDIRPDGVLVWKEGAANPVMIASDTDLDNPARTIEIGVPFGAVQ